MSVVWLVDDDRNLLRIFTAVLQDGGHEVRAFSSAPALLDALGAVAPDVVVADLQMPGMDGLALLAELRRCCPLLPVIMATAHGSIDRAVEAMKLGAYDFLTKPVESDKLQVVVRNAIERTTLRREVERLRARRTEDLQAVLIGVSGSMAKVKDLIARVAPLATTVLITGETGTGKEIVARAIHALSPRAAEPFIVVNCGAIPGELVEAELFGALRGAYTGSVKDRKGRFEAADGGTIFLDEIGELPLAAQAKLLRVLEERKITPVGGTQERSVDVRVVSATNRDLQQNVKEGRFREDLLYRLNVFPIALPPLRDRRDDIAPLAVHFLERLAGSDVPHDVSADAMRLLRAHDWPGNVRELRNLLERAVVLAEEVTIEAAHLPGLLTAAPRPGRVEIEIPEEGLNLDLVEKTLIEQAIEKTGGNQSRAARLLGIPRSALIYRMEKYGIRK